MADTFQIADHHFENAGIEPDKVEDQTTGDNKGTADEKNEVDTESGNENPVKEQQQAKEAGDKKPAADAKDSDGGGTNDGKKEEPKKEEPKPNRSEAELDEEGLAAVREGKPTRPEIAQRWRYQRDTARQERDASKSVISRLEQENNSYKQQVEAYKASTTVLGELPPVEVPRAIRLYSALKTNPIATLKQMLVEAKANGHNIEGIGEGVDTAAINALLDQRLKPFEQNKGSQDQPRPVSETPTVDNDDDLFLQAFPDAQTHLDIMVQMLNKNIEDVRAGKAQRIMGNSELYFTLKNAAIAQGFDFSKPLQPQIDARKQQGNVTPPQQKVEEKGDPTPRLNGRGDGITEPLISTGGVEESFGDIVKRALAQHKPQQ